MSTVVFSRDILWDLIARICICMQQHNTYLQLHAWWGHAFDYCTLDMWRWLDEIVLHDGCSYFKLWINSKVNMLGWWWSYNIDDCWSNWLLDSRSFKSEVFLIEHSVCDVIDVESVFACRRTFLCSWPDEVTLAEKRVDWEVNMPSGHHAWFLMWIRARV